MGWRRRLPRGGARSARAKGRSSLVRSKRPALVPLQQRMARCDLHELPNVLSHQGVSEGERAVCACVRALHARPRQSAPSSRDVVVARFDLALALQRAFPSPFATSRINIYRPINRNTYLRTTPSPSKPFVPLENKVWGRSSARVSVCLLMLGRCSLCLRPSQGGRSLWVAFTIALASPIVLRKCYGARDGRPRALRRGSLAHARRAAARRRPDLIIIVSSRALPPTNTQHCTQSRPAATMSEGDQGKYKSPSDPVK